MSRTNQILTRLTTLFRLQVRWLFSKRLTFRQRVGYPISCLLLPFRDHVAPFGRKFSSDNRLGLLLLPDYLNLIGSVVDRISHQSDGELRVLDIGANVGQFGFFVSHITPAKILSFEPNPVSFKHLVANGANSEMWLAVPRAVAASEGQATLYFVPGKSAQGSMSRANSTADLIGSHRPESITIEAGPISSETLVSLGLEPSTVFQLVKIDVEGFELEALRGVRKLRFDYLLIEVSENRDHGFTVDQLQEVAKHDLKIELEEVWSDGKPGIKSTRNVLFRSKLIDGL